MFTSIEQVKAITGYDVTLDEVNQAQAIIEVFIGRVDTDVDDPYDRDILGKATAFQAAYMHNNADRIYEQVAMRSIAQTDGGVTLNTDMLAPFIAPMAYMAARGLSWKRSRSVHTGSIHGGPRFLRRWVTD